MELAHHLESVHVIRDSKEKIVRLVKLIQNVCLDHVLMLHFSVIVIMDTKVTFVILQFVLKDVKM